jgi:hypothetical protein
MTVHQLAICESKITLNSIAIIWLFAALWLQASGAVWRGTVEYLSHFPGHLNAFLSLTLQLFSNGEIALERPSPMQPPLQRLWVAFFRSQHGYATVLIRDDSSVVPKIPHCRLRKNDRR